MSVPPTEGGAGLLLEREDELAALDGALAATEESGDGRLVLVEGSPGIGKTALLGFMVERARSRAGRIFSAVGSEMERDFGFGLVRQLFDPAVRDLDPKARERLFIGPAALAAAIFGLGEAGAIDVAPTEGALYGLFWLLVGLAGSAPLVLVIDDAHWADVASLRFVAFLAHRLDGLPATVVLAARPHEPGPQAAILDALGGSTSAPPVRPTLLTRSATAMLVRDALDGSSSEAVEAACHESTGGNPLLIEALLRELAERGEAGAPPAVEKIAAIGTERIGAGVLKRAAELDPGAPAVVKAAAILGQGADRSTLAALAGVAGEDVPPILDGLVAATILAPGSERRFAHPLLRAAVYESMPAASRAAMHARAAAVMTAHGAEAEAVAAHLLLCEPGDSPVALEILEAAAERAAERGAPEGVVTYLGRAVPEAREPARRGALLHRLGSAGVALRDPASIGRLQEAAGLVDNPARALDILIELADTMATAGLWGEAVATTEDALARFEGSGLPGLLDLEAIRAAALGYDPTTAPHFAAEMPRLLDLVGDRVDPRSRHLRWLLAGLGSCGYMPDRKVLALIGPASQPWTLVQSGRESTLIAQAAFGYLQVGALEEMELLVEGIEEDARRRGSLMATMGALGFRAALDQQRGRLDAAGENLLATVELLQRNQMSLMALTTFLHSGVETLIERRALDSVGTLVEGVEMPAPFDRTASGAMLLEVRGALRLERGDRTGAVTALRESGESMERMGFSPRFTRWRSRLALALPARERAEALELAGEELRLAKTVGSRPAAGAALRALGLLNGGEKGLDQLRQAVGSTPEASSLERARSLTELGAALGRANRRKEAREKLLEAFDLAQRCGAERLEGRIAEELRVAGAKPRRRAVSGPDSLTPSERRVASAAADGATNREIGQMLFVAPRTVETHLTSTYRKLGISSRAGLGAALAPQDVPTDSGSGSASTAPTTTRGGRRSS